MGMEELITDPLYAEIDALQAENEMLDHAIAHIRDCKETKLCKECKWLIEQALKGK